MPHIFLATPCYGGMVTHRYFHSVLDLMLYAGANGPPVTVETLACDSLIPRARNALVAKFMAHPSATHLLFVDADIGFSPAHLARLLAFGAEVSACMYPLKQMTWDAPAVARARGGELITTAPLRYVGKPCEPPLLQQRDGFVTADYAGAGFLLVARTALARMIAANGNLHYTADHASPDMPAEHLYALFDTGIDRRTGHYLSEDYCFCQRWRALGGEIWLDTQSALSHSGTFEFQGEPGVRFDVGQGKTGWGVPPPPDPPSSIGLGANANSEPN